MNKHLTALAIGLVAIILIVLGLGVNRNDTTGTLGSVAYNVAPRFTIATSTVFTITTTSQRILSTSTPTVRLAAMVQPVNCTNGQPLYLKAGADQVAVATSGIAVYASTTMQFEDYPGTPVPQGSVTAITGLGTCTVLVTEWRSQY